MLPYWSTTAFIDSEALIFMIDFKALASRLPYYLQNCKNRNIKANPTQILELLNRYNKQARSVEGFKSHRDQLEADSAEHPEGTTKAGKYSEANVLLEQIELKKIETALYKEIRKLPNSTHPDVPISESKVVKEYTGALPEGSKDFVTIANEQNLILRTPYGHELTAKGVRLERGLIDYGLDFLHKEYNVISLPSLIPQDFAKLLGEKTKSVSRKFVLSNSAETSLLSCVPVGSNEKYKYCGVSVSFAEDGDSITQATQVATVSVCDPDKSEEEHAKLTNLHEAFLASLSIPYRILNVSAKELSVASYQTFLLQAWLPSRKEWVNLSTTSNCTDFISRRLNWANDKVYMHSLQSSLFHSKSLIAVLVELSARGGELGLPSALSRYTINF
mmetsp:Transcript_7873/g.15235  ORF Transcript_7873/g.15235 Transcript_7873/m.15235 type:complete len:389 (+) Transcript_7873:151-1317(+)